MPALPTFEKFLSISMHEKFDVVITFGVFLDYRIEEQKQVFLYSVEKFFVELDYNPEINKIIHVAAVESSEILYKYSGTNQKFLDAGVELV